MLAPSTLFYSLVKSVQHYKLAKPTHPKTMMSTQSIQFKETCLQSNVGFIEVAVHYDIFLWEEISTLNEFLLGPTQGHLRLDLLRAQQSLPL